MTDRHGDHGLGDDQRYDRAWGFVIEHQGAQVCKSADLPYTTHLRSVARLVLQDGGTSCEVVGGLLHDIVEDTPVLDGGHSVDIAEISEVFGQRVAQIVDFCTDAAPGPHEAKAPWRQRKERHFEHLRTADPGTLRVIVADKTDNISSQLADFEACAGDPVALSDSLARFKGGFAGTLWYYRGIHAVLGDRVLDSAIYRDFSDRIVDFGRCCTPANMELWYRDRLRLVLDRVDPAAVGMVRVIDGHYAIDASELARRRSVPTAGKPDEIVERLMRQWYGEDAWDGAARSLVIDALA